jgi:hypothetical protein
MPDLEGAAFAALAQKTAHATMTDPAYRKSEDLAHGNGPTGLRKTLSMKGTGLSSGHTINEGYGLQPVRTPNKIIWAFRP